MTRRGWLRLALATAIVAVVAAFFASGLHRDLSWDSLRSRIDQIKSWVDSQFALALILFATLYVVVTALSLPVSTYLSILSGALFGRWIGTGVVSLAATMGATIAMLTSRFLFREAVERRFGRRLQPILDGVARDGGWYLVSIRLVPLFPYFLVNLAMGLTPIRTGTYALATYVGMLPLTFLFVNAGTTIAEVKKPGDVLSPGVIASLVAVAAVPLVLRWIVNKIKRK